MDDVALGLMVVVAVAARRAVKGRSAAASAQVAVSAEEADGAVAVKAARVAALVVAVENWAVVTDCASGHAERPTRQRRSVSPARL